MSSRITRSNREIGLRRTRKRSHNQVGGASFYLPTSEYFKDGYVTNNGTWALKLEKAGVPAESVKQILKLFTYKKSDTLAPAPAPPDAPAGPPADLPEAWLDANKYRNPIMKVGLEIIMNNLGISGEMTEKEILQKITGFNTDSASSFVKILKELFTDLEKILTLDHPDINLDKGVDGKIRYSKLELMFKDDGENTAQELSLLLLYPMRIQNLLIQSVAVVVLNLQEQEEMEKIKTNVNNNILKTILVNKWTNYSLVLCMSQTNDNIRDSFAEGHEPTTHTGVRQFWISFVDQLNKPAIQFSNPENLNIDLGILACEYAKHLKDSSGNDFLDSNKLTRLTEYKLFEEHKKGLPDIFDNIPLFNKLLPESILFLKQLECAVELARAKLSTP